jgi:hypothetical protein
VRSRAQTEALLVTPVYLDLRVKVGKECQRDPKQLNRLGFRLISRHGLGGERLGSSPRPTSWALNRSMLSIAVIA